MTAYANVLSFVTAFPLMSLIIQDDHYAHYHRRPFPHKARLAAYRAGMLGRKPTRCPRSQVAGNHSDLLCAGSAARRSGGDSDSAAVASAASGPACDGSRIRRNCAGNLPSTARGEDQARSTAARRSWAAGNSQVSAPVLHRDTPRSPHVVHSTVHTAVLTGPACGPSVARQEAPGGRFSPLLG